MFKQLLADLRRHEGKLLKAYWDDIGKVWTIGYGSTGEGITEGTVWTNEQAEIRLERDARSAVATARRLFKNYETLSPVRKGVLANMAYNLGYNRLAGFKKMIEAVQMEDFDKAALEMINSRWYVQVKTRGTELVRRMKSNKIDPRHLIKEDN